MYILIDMYNMNTKLETLYCMERAGSMRILLSILILVYLDKYEY
jgi:hypothetical protein